MKYLLIVIAALSINNAMAQTDATSKGNAYYQDGDYVLAEQQYRLAPNDPVAQFNLANALIQQKKYKEAQDILNGLSQTAKDKNIRQAAFYNVGVTYSKQKDLESSIEAYKSALRLDPTDKNARDNLQKALLEQKKQQSSSQSSSSKMNSGQADQKLKQLEDKEKQLQQKMQGKQQGGGQQKDW